MLAFSSVRGDSRRPVSPFDRDHGKAASVTFDRMTGDPVEVSALQSYAAELAQYHLSPEAKFLNGEFLDSGTTLRRHVIARDLISIGKEADRWEEQFFLGLDEETRVTYPGANPSSRLIDDLRSLQNFFGQRELSSRLGISRATLTHLLSGKSTRLGASELSRLGRDLTCLAAEQETVKRENDHSRASIKASIEQYGLKRTAKVLGVDASNLLKVMSGKRNPSASIVNAMREL